MFKKVIISMLLFCALSSLNAQDIPNAQIWGNTKIKLNTENGDSSGFAKLSNVLTWTNVSGRPTALSQFTNDLNLGSLYQPLENQRVSTTNAVSFSTIASTVATGTAPLTVTSTTPVTNLNADFLDDQHGSFYRNATNINAGTLADARLSSNIPLKNAANTFTAIQTINVASDQPLVLNKPTGGTTWNYIGFSVGGTRNGYFGISSLQDMYFGLDGTNNSIVMVPTGTGSVNVSNKKVTNMATATATTDGLNLGTGDARYLGISAKAVNSTLLQGKDTAQIAQRDAVNTFTEYNTFNKRIGIGGAIDNSYMVNVTGNGKFSTSLDVGTSITASLLNLTGLASSTTNTEVLTISSNVVKSQNVKDLEIAAYQPVTLSAFTSDVGGGVFKHILTLDCGNYYQKNFKVNMNNNSATAGTQITFTNMKPGGIYTVTYYNNSVRDILYDSSAKLEDGSTNFSVISQSGAFTHHFRGISTSAVMKAF